MWSDRIFHAVAGCQAHQPQAAFRDHLRRSDSVAIIFFGSTGPLARNQNHTLGYCTCGCRERNEARKTSSRTSLGDGIQAIVQRLKPRGQTDRQQTRLMAGLPGQPPSLPHLFSLGFPGLRCTHPQVLPQRTRPPVFPSPHPFPFPSSAMAGVALDVWCKEREPGKVPRVFHFHFHFVSQFHFLFAFPSSPLRLQGIGSDMPSHPVSTTLGSLGIGTMYKNISNITTDMNVVRIRQEWLRPLPVPAPENDSTFFSFLFPTRHHQVIGTP